MNCVTGNFAAVAAGETLTGDPGSAIYAGSELHWYCARTKPKHEHIASGNLRQLLGLEVFNAQLRHRRITVRGPVRVVEPLFPCYIFIRCVLRDSLTDIRYTSGVGAFVNFGGEIPPVPDHIIEDLRESFETDDSIIAEDGLVPGAQVVFTSGAFTAMNASVLRVMTAGQRVQVLMDILGRPTAVEVERSALEVQDFSMAERLPKLVLQPSRKVGI